jgi:predicted dehydrogenase
LYRKAILMDKIGICVIGSGRAGMIHAHNFAKRVPHARLVCLVDPDETTVKTACNELDVKKYYLDYREALADVDVDAVVVVTPTHLHKEIVVAAANARKHIFCEKPMAMNVSECDIMIGAAQKNNVKLQLGFMRRYDKSFVAAKEAIENGAIGDVVLVKSLTHGPSIPRPWQYDIKASNGPLAEVNSHDIDTLRWFTNSEFASVYAIGGNFRCPEAKASFPDFYDNVVLVSTFTNGMQGFIDGAVSVRYGYDSRVEILGTNGIIFVGQTNENSTVVCNDKTGLVTPFTQSWRTLFTNAYFQEDFEFIQCIVDDKQPRVSGTDGKMAVKVVNAGNESIIQKKPVSVDKM